MKVFLSYGSSKQDLAIITKRMRTAVDILNAHGHSAYCNMFDPDFGKIEERGDVKALFRQAINALEESEVVITIIASPNRSVGQIMEIGVAMSQGKAVYLLVHASAEDSTYLPKLVTKTYTWTTETELEAVLASFTDATFGS